MADEPTEAPPVEAVEPAAEPSADPSPFASLESELNGAPPAPVSGADGGQSGRMDLVFEVPVCLSVELGRTEVPIREVVNLGRGSIIELDRGPGTPLDVRVNGVLIGRGEVVLVNAEKLGLRFVEVVNQADGPKRPG